MSDAPSNMWRYYRDKYGAVEAVTEHYSKRLAENTQLQLLLLQIEGATLLIDRIMTIGAVDMEEDE